MNYHRVHSLLSKASEAIVSQDGKVKRRLNNYETVLGNGGEDDPFYIPDGAVNDNYGNLNYLTQEVRNRSLRDRLSQLRYAMLGAFALVLIGFSWSIYSFLLPTTSSLNQGAVDPNDLLAATVNETQLERVANLIVQDGDWDQARIILFMKHWNASSDEAKQSYRDMAWFQHFNYRLETKFDRAKHTGELYDAATNKRPFLDLAIAMGVADPNVNYAQGQQSKDYQALESAVATELANLEQSKLNGNKNNNQVVADESALSKLLRDIKGRPLLAGSDKGDEFIAPESKKVVTAKKPKVDAKPVQVAAATPPLISEQDVSRVFNKYAAAYEKGDLKELSNLFGVNDPRQGKQIVAKLKSNYENIFQNSNKRSVNFAGINWRFDGDKATVDSDYLAKIELKGNKGTQTVSANARVNLRKSANALTISSFELLNRSVNVVTPELNITTARKNERQRPATPTAAELQDIVTKLVSSYETGDITTFSNLFAVNAKTNDRQDLTGIKSDYSELFNSSNDRQMFIQDMKWKYDDQHAKGTGDLEAIVLSEGGQAVYTLTGKIQLVAKRIDGKVRITHMYHIERAK